nr:DEAD/DEAH box helicase [uncultured Methanolobus sp.]
MIKVQSLPLPQNAIDFYIDSGIEELYPSQGEAANRGLLEGKDILAVTSFVSEKRLIAELVILRHVLNGGKALYITPWPSLATENCKHFKRFELLGVKVGRFTGNIESRAEQLDDYDIIVCTLENIDSMMVNGTMWINSFSIIVMDELNLLGDPNIGCTMDVVITKLRSISDVQRVYLSESIENAEVLADHLEAELSINEWRPYFLHEDQSFCKIMQFNEGTESFKAVDEHEIKDMATDIILDTIRQDIQCVVFAKTSKNCIDLAQKFSNFLYSECTLINDLLDNDTKYALNNIAKKIEQSSKKQESKVLADCIRNGVAFEHGKLKPVERELIETGFKDKFIKMIFGTSAIDDVLDIPPKMLIERHSCWYHLKSGETPSLVYGFNKMIRKTSRRPPHPYGYSVLLEKKHNGFELLQEKLIYLKTGKAESYERDVYTLRRHVLGIISSDMANSPSEVTEFFSRTFSAYMGNSVDFVQETLNFLCDQDMISYNDEKLSITPLGGLVSSMNIDPSTLATIVHELNIANTNAMEITEMSILQLICKTVDFCTVDIKNRVEAKDYYDYADAHKHEIIDFPDFNKIDKTQREHFLETIKSALILKEWINESDVGKINAKYPSTNGDLHILKTHALWIASGMKLIAILKNQNLDFNDLDIRLKYGVCAELIPLVSINGIGRKNARKLFDNGIESVDMLSSLSFEQIAKIIGEQLAEKVCNQLKIPIPTKTKSRKKVYNSTLNCQRSIIEYYNP